jgi:DNA-binding PadR family transcriptional regulator
MRFVVKTYADGGKAAYETTDDGSEVVQELLGPRGQPGTRIRAFVEMACDETEQGVDSLLESLHWLEEELTRRRDAFPRAKRRAR